MSKGKYSPFLTREMIDKSDPDQFVYNALGAVAPDYTVGDPYDVKVHFGNYDAEGFDTYGYSAWYEDGTYAGLGEGIDRGGYTEDQYMAMTDDEFNDLV
jgi:hypothetical protein